jgi:hypothetical protein
MKKCNPSGGQNGQLVHWWLLIHSGRKDGQVCQYQLLHFPVCKLQLSFHQLEGRRGVGLLPPQVPNNYFIFQNSFLQ